MPVPGSAKAPLVSFHGAVALPGSSHSSASLCCSGREAQEGQRCLVSDTEPWIRPWATSLTLPFPCCFWG